MPRACPVESHARCYNERAPLFPERCHGRVPWSLRLAATTRAPHLPGKMPRARPVESHARGYNEGAPLFPERCHGLAPWSHTLAAWEERGPLSGRSVELATNVRLHGTSPWHLQTFLRPGSFLAANVRLHGTSPWHLQNNSSA